MSWLPAAKTVASPYFSMSSTNRFAPSRAEATCASMSATSWPAARELRRMKFHIARFGSPLR